MRRVVIALLVLVACRKAGDFGSSTPTLEPEPPVVVEAPPTSRAADDPTLGTAPPSKPTGAPVAITIVPQRVGDVRVRTLESHGTFEFEYKTTNRQRSHNRYELREELQKIEAGTRLFRVTVNRATEAVLLNDKPHEVTTLVGPYIVAAFAPGNKRPIGVTREDGSEIGGREVEELSDLFLFDSGKPNLLVEIVAKRPLRVGESYLLTEEENIFYGGGRKVLGDIWVTLIKVDGKVAQYQSDMTLNFAVDNSTDTNVRKLRYLVKVDITTGKLVELQEIHHTLETSPPDGDKPAFRQSETRHLTMRISYPRP